MIATASKHLAFWLACLVAVACAGPEAPRAKRTTAESDSAETDVPRKKKKKKKKPPVVAEADEDSEGTAASDGASEGDDEERERQERRERMRQRDGGDAAREATAEADTPARPSEEDEIEKRREKERKRARAAFGRKDDPEEGVEEAPATEDAEAPREGEDAEDAADRKRRKEAQKRREAADAKQAAADARKEAAARKREEARRKREEAAEARRAAAEARKEEAARREAEKQAAEDAKKADAAEARASKKKQRKTKKETEAEPPADDVDADAPTKVADEPAETGDGGDSSDEAEKPAKPARRPAKKKNKKGGKQAVAKKAPAAESDEAPIDMTENEPAKKPAAEADAEPEEDDKPIDLDKIEADDDPLKQKRVAAIPVPGVDDDAGGQTTDAPETARALVPLISRPLTLHKRGLEAHGGMRVNMVRRVTNATPPTYVTDTSESLLLGGSYGVSDKAEVGLDYAISVNPGSIKGPLTLRGAYSLASGKLDAAVAGALALDFYEESNSMTTVSRTYASLQLGAWVRYHATTKLALYTGLPALPPSGVGLITNGGLPPLPYQLLVGLNNKQPIAFAVPVGFAYQVAPGVYTALSLELASFALSNGKTALAFRDFIPFSLAAFYSLPKLDIGFTLGDDAKVGTDALRFDAVLRYSIK